MLIAMLLTLLLVWSHLGQAVFVRHFPCAPTDAPPVNPMFDPISLSAELDVSDSTTLSLRLYSDILEYDECQALGDAYAEPIVNVSVLGHPVGVQKQSSARCPTVPSMDAPRWDPRIHSEFLVSYSLDSPHRFSTLATTFRVPLNNGTELACVAANITPDLGSTAVKLLKGIPLTIMLLSVIIAAGIKFYMSRQSSIFRYEIANSSHDPAESFLPGLGDCLQYLQFIFMSGCLTLLYPGYFRPVVSQLAWSSLIYANGPITHQFIYPGVEKGIYTFNGTYGLEEMAQILGATTMSDLWPNAIINLSVMVLVVVVIIQIASLLKWMWRLFPFWGPPKPFEPRTEFLAHMQHAGWSVLRMVLYYYPLPIATFSLYQPLMTYFPVYRSFLAVSVVALLGVSLGFLVRYLKAHGRQDSFFSESTLPGRSTRKWFFDALYGLPLIRGVAIGALQVSGIGQIIILIACEIALIVCLLLYRKNGSVWKPIGLSAVRLTTMAMSCAFLPSVGLNEGSKGLVGYFILSLHASALILGFLVPSLLNCAMYILVRLGVLDSHFIDMKPDQQNAPVFGLNQLSRRSKRGTSFSHLPPLSPPDQSITAYITHTPLPRPGSSEGELCIADDASQFYRAPRRNPSSYAPTDGTRTIRSMPSSSDMGDSAGDSGGSSMELIEEDEDDLASDRASNVDYSVRESDQYYRRTRIVMGSNQSADTGSQSKPPRTLPRWKQRKPKEKGFEVIRPGRPPSEG
ncbi:hypothetical protein P170DRAFT_397304 [Aspergillus steynii IBT 23096]|uniref:TRP C-terminal domain-containing protein n=1 Tax=Aspergillus steynii IBT 23096 TaxID=1392250 RepID=A0A2I2GMR8_9EURO|nr:uncharacterized protein P170DRAFT_397304 [Aspergillus steynii IBT 23096]PLB54191.1 hypothetical protein P170DRAFT_397304 [Aspergillus steynii IBT 23096]